MSRLSRFGLITLLVGFAFSVVTPKLLAEEIEARRSGGHYRVTLGVARPTFTDIKNYEEFYGNVKGMPSLQVDYLFFNWFLTVGLTGHGSFYKDKGHAVHGGTVDADREGPTEITIIPLQAGITVEGSPFRAKWIVLNGWFGYEKTYFQEVRTVESADDTGETASSSGSETGDGESSGSSTSSSPTSGNSQYVNDGWKDGTALGASISFKLNELDGQSSNSLRSIGISGVYFTPYLEVVKAVTRPGQKKGITFSRSMVGIAFTFETI